MTRRNYSGASKPVLLWLLALLVTACASATPNAPTNAPIPPRVSDTPGSNIMPAPAADAPLTPRAAVKIGSVPALGESSLYLAIDKGYLEQEGLEVEIVPFQTGNAMIAPITTGQLDAGIGGIGPGLFNAVARGLGMRIVAGASSNAVGRSQWFIARRELVDADQLNDYADLKGRTVAATASLGQMHPVYERALARAGLTLDDVNIVTLGFPEMVAALGNGAIDVTYLIEPFATRAVDSGTAVRWRPASDVYPDQLAQVWMYGEQFVEQRPDVARRLMVALVRGMRDYEDAVEKNQGRAEVVSAIVKHTPIKDPALIERMVFAKIPPSGEVNVESLQRDMEWFKARGGVPDSPDLAQVVDNRFTDYAIQRLGPYR